MGCGEWDGGGGICGAGGEVGGVDLVVGQACLAEDVAVGGPQVEEPAAGPGRGSGRMKSAAAGPKAWVTAWWTSGPTW